MKGSPSRGEGRKAVIAEAALTLFLERGFGVPIEEVAVVAGASKQTIYKFFGGREGLVAAAMELELARVIGPMRAAVALDASAADRLEAFGVAYQDVIFSPDCLTMFRYVIGEARDGSSYADAFSATVVDTVIDLIEPSVAKVAGPSGLTARERADAFIGALQGAELNRALAGSPVSPERLAALRTTARAVLAA